MLVEVGLHLLEDSWNKVKACVWRSERRIHAGIPSSAHSTNIDRFRWVDKCRSDQCIIIKLPYLSWEKKHPCRIILCQDRMVWYNKRRTEFSVQEGGHWIDVAASWIVHIHIVSFIIAVEVEAFTGGFYDNSSTRNKQNSQHCCSSPNVHDDFYDHMFFDFRFKS